MTTSDVKPPGSRSLSQLRRTHPTDSTLENLISVLRMELELCARLPVFEYEATTEGHDETAGLLRKLAEAERSHVDEVLRELQRHLNARNAAGGVSS